MAKYYLQRPLSLLPCMWVLLFFSTPVIAQWTRHSATGVISPSTTSDKVSLGRTVPSIILGHLEINGHTGSSLFRLHSQTTNYIWLVENELNYKGGYIAYDNGGNSMFLGLHDADDTNVNNDAFSISLRRPHGFVGIKQLNPNASLDVNHNQINHTTALGQGAVAGRV